MLRSCGGLSSFSSAIVSIIRRPVNLPLWEILFLAFFCCGVSYNLSTYRFDIIMRDLLWENAACRLPALFLVLMWSWTLTIFACERAKYDLSSIFEGSMLNGKQLFTITKVCTYVFFTLQTCDLILTGRYVLSLIRLDVLLFLVFLCIMMFLNPFEVLYSSSRFSLINTMVELTIFPLSECVLTFWHILVADYMTSLSKMLTDMQDIICLGQNSFTQDLTLSQMLNAGHRSRCLDNFFSPFIQFLPFFWRACQCLRNYQKTKVSASSLLSHIYIYITIVPFPSLSLTHIHLVCVCFFFFIILLNIM